MPPTGGPDGGWCGVACGATACGILYWNSGLAPASQIHTFPSFAKMALGPPLLHTAVSGAGIQIPFAILAPCSCAHREETGDGSGGYVTAIHVGDQDGVPVFRLAPASVPAAVCILEANQRIEDLSVPVHQINFKT